MPSKTLLNYINAEHSKQISDNAIRKQCLAAGWPPTMVDDTFTFLYTGKDGSNGQFILSLKKKNPLISVISIIFGLLTILSFIKLITFGSMVPIIQRNLIEGTTGALPFEFLTYNGWYYPSVYGLILLQVTLCLRLFFTISSRTKRVWITALLSLVLLVIIDFVIIHLSTQFVPPIDQLSKPL